ncbi:MAG: translation initiation factor IF-1 [bacterium]
MAKFIKKKISQKIKQTSTGIVLEAFPNTLFNVKIDNDEKELLCYLAGKMRLHRIKILIGDRVEVILDEYGGKGRIIRRI